MNSRTIDDRSFLWFGCWTLDYINQVERTPSAADLEFLPPARANAEAQHRAWHFECLAELRRDMARSLLASSAVPDAVAELPVMRQFLDDLGRLVEYFRVLELGAPDVGKPLFPADYAPGKATVREVVSATWLSHGSPDRTAVAKLLSRGIPTGCDEISYDKVRHLLTQYALQMSGHDLRAGPSMAHGRAFIIPTLHEQRVYERLWAGVNDRRSIRSVKCETADLVRSGEFLTLYQAAFSDDLNAVRDSVAAIDAVRAAAIVALEALLRSRRAQEAAAAKSRA